MTVQSCDGTEQEDLHPVLEIMIIEVSVQSSDRDLGA